MTVNRINHEYRTILDFSKDKDISKNFIQQALRQIEVLDFNINNKLLQTVTVIHNDIQIGMFKIRLILHQGRIKDSKFISQKLKSYGNFQIKIYEQSPRSINLIDLFKSELFKNQFWINKNYYNGLIIKDLVKIIAHCDRLNKLRMFS